MSYSPRLKKQYKEEIIPSLTEKFGYKTVMRVPKLQKIVISQGLGDAVADKKIVDNAILDVSRIAGQRAVATISKKTFLTSNYVKECQLVQKLRYVEIRCTIF
jgi:large subunit ribosomal protein L5